MHWNIDSTAKKKYDANISVIFLTTARLFGIEVTPTNNRNFKTLQYYSSKWCRAARVSVIFRAKKKVKIAMTWVFSFHSKTRRKTTCISECQTIKSFCLLKCLMEWNETQPDCLNADGSRELLVFDCEEATKRKEMPFIYIIGKNWWIGKTICECSSSISFSEVCLARVLWIVFGFSSNTLFSV